MKKAFITGINGQDGSYLTEFLIEKGYEVHGLVRRNSTSESQTIRIEHLRNTEAPLVLHYGDLTDAISLQSICSKYKFDEVYNLGAMSNVGVSFECPIYTQWTNYVGFINLVEALKSSKQLNTVKIYQASSSEMFGNNVDKDGFQRETTYMSPVSPYGLSKLSAHKYAQHLRNDYNVFVSCGILFNHESPRRGSSFVTGKVAKAVARIKLDKQVNLVLGNLSSKRDWGHSKDYVKIMWKMLNEIDIADDFICCTGITHSVEDLVKFAFGYINKDILENKFEWNKRVFTEIRHTRESELHYLRGCNNKLSQHIDLDFEYSFETMITEMIEHHLHRQTII